LSSYQTNTGCRDRLETVVDPSYTGSPYFTSCEVAIIKSLQISGSKGPAMLAELIDEIVQVRLEWRMKKQVESVDFRVCAAHDVAPIVEKV
ncbi:hypothetical protein F5882DRAFT_267518, partial [Hyaloscypha sp. PMI_1271]